MPVHATWADTLLGPTDDIETLQWFHGKAWQRSNPSRDEENTRAV